MSTTLEVEVPVQQDVFAVAEHEHLEACEPSWDEDDVMFYDDTGKSVCFHLHLVPIVCEPLRDATGGELWSASLVLARKLLFQQGLVHGRSVLELGAGCGLVAMVAAYCGASCVVCSDGNESICANIRRNVVQNSLLWPRVESSSPEPVIKVEALRWEDAAARTSAGIKSFDVLLGSDLIYGDQGEALASAVDVLLAPAGKLLLCCPSDRRGLTDMEASLKRRGFLLNRTSTTGGGDGALEEAEPSSDEDDDDALWLSQRSRSAFFLYTCTRLGRLGAASIGSSL